MFDEKRIALIAGDGIGPEVVAAARQVLEALPLPISFVTLEAGFDCFQRTGSALPAATLDALRGCDGAIFGAVSSPSGVVEGYSSPILAIRTALDLYANLRPTVSMPVADSRADVDLLIVRENTECLYVRREHLEDNGNTAIAQRVITRAASERIARRACMEAMRRSGLASRRRTQPMLTIVHKANVLSVSDGLFRDAALDITRGYPDLVVEEQLVDSMVYRLIREPQRYDVVVAPNLYGDILSDAAAALVGGLGVAPSANVGDGFMLVEPVHGSAPDIAGQGIANPVATILASAMLLEGWGWHTVAAALRAATLATVRAGVHTPDLGGSATTADVVTAVIARLAHTFEMSTESTVPQVA